MEARTVAEAWTNRVVAWGTVAPDQLLANPLNFRRHPNVQREALRGSLDELGVIAPVIVNRTTGNLVDGHARVEEYLSAGVEEVPVAYVELTEEQERLALLALDPISGLAVNDHRALNALLAEVETTSEGLRALLDGLARQAQTYQPEYDPDIETREVTAEDIARAAAGMNPNITERDQVRVLCPGCGMSFFVDATSDGR